MNESNKHLSTPMGIHRLLREPYDDREVFTSVTDMVEYCKNGARYNGQKISCVIDNNINGGEYDSYVLNFNVVNNFPILDLPTGELYSKEITINGSTNRYVLIYNYNPIATNSGIMIDIGNGRKIIQGIQIGTKYEKYLTTSFDPFMFSLLDIAGIFKNNIDDNFEFVLIRNNTTSSITTNTYIKQSYNPVDDYNYIYTRTRNITENEDNNYRLTRLLYLAGYQGQTTNPDLKILPGLIEAKYYVDINNTTLASCYLFPNKGGTVNTGENKIITSLYIKADEYLAAADMLRGSKYG